MDTTDPQFITLSSNEVKQAIATFITQRDGLIINQDNIQFRMVDRWVGKPQESAQRATFDGVEILVEQSS